mmetsp:Transcript_2120/g.5671  ORF Transcript_2120/g.5671 Transcript_2120/m.5671 type:complete len:233 (-) Transcript_2120:401-1099(-)
MICLMSSWFTDDGWCLTSSADGGSLSDRRAKVTAKDLSRWEPSAVKAKRNRACGVMTAICRMYWRIFARYDVQLPSMTTEIFVPRHGAAPGSGMTRSSDMIFGSFLAMSISSTHFVIGPPAFIALTTSTGIPVLIFAQISAIFDPSPNFPRLCFTQYFVPVSTRPSISGRSSCGIPMPLSVTVTRKRFARADAAGAGAAGVLLGSAGVEARAAAAASFFSRSLRSLSVSTSL